MDRNIERGAGEERGQRLVVWSAWKNVEGKREREEEEWAWEEVQKRQEV